MLGERWREHIEHTLLEGKGKKFAPKKKEMVLRKCFRQWVKKHGDSFFLFFFLLLSRHKSFEYFILLNGSLNELFPKPLFEE